jgi:hydrogenase maturation protein HypF
LLQADDDARSPVLACDHHPEYFSSRWARDQSESTIPVWHHQAHVLSGMCEHRWLDRKVLGVAWDGTGLGPDGTIWGGEFLVTSAASFERVASFQPFFLPGGEAAISDVRRTAAAILLAGNEGSETELANELAMTVREIVQIRRLLQPALSPRTTSCGRLFDAAACLILGQRRSDFEGHAAMCLEAACDPATHDAYAFVVEGHLPHRIDWRPVFQAIRSDRRRGLPSGVMAMKFHRGLSNLIRDVSQRHSSLPVVLQGGVFQNRVLIELIAGSWPGDGPPLGMPGRIPPNDGGLAIGQVIFAMSSTKQEQSHVPGSSGPSRGVDRT